MDHFIFILFASFIEELLIAGYYVAISRRNVKVALVCTVLISIVPYLIVKGVLEDFNNLPAVAVGNGLGTIVVLKFGGTK